MKCYDKENISCFENLNDGMFLLHNKAAKMYYEADCNIGLLDGKTVAVAGWREGAGVPAEELIAEVGKLGFKSNLGESA